MSAVAELAAETDTVAAIGHNNPPPEPTPFDAIKVRIEDLLTEAHNWADGTVVESQEQADEASRLIDDLNKAAAEAEKLRVVEKAPLDEAVAEIQARYNLYIADRKNKAPGKVWKAVDALKATVKPFLDRLESERQAAALKAREEAEATAKVAAEAARAALDSDLAAKEAAEALVDQAAALDAAAKRAENAKAQARGGERALGLKRTFTPVLTDARAAVLHYMAHDKGEFIALVERLAARDVREGKRTIPGFEVVEGTKL